MPEALETAVFADGSAYEKFMGERSRLSAQLFLKLLTMRPGLRWLVVGCGTVRNQGRPGSGE